MSDIESGVIIIDYGSQFTQLIARRVREQKVYCEIRSPNESADRIRKSNPKGIILSGGPNSVYDDGAPQLSRGIVDLDIPTLGICYGMYLVALAAGGEVESSGEHEYGRADLEVLDTGGVFAGFEGGELVQVWMSHGDRITSIPPDFKVTGASANSPIAAFEAPGLGLYGLQFHPEVVHSVRGKEMLHNFLFSVCDCKPDWTAGHFITEHVAAIRRRVGSKRAICGLSGGVDSAVAAARRT